MVAKVFKAQTKERQPEELIHSLIDKAVGACNQKTNLKIGLRENRKLLKKKTA